jgi:hypothetical protein
MTHTISDSVKTSQQQTMKQREYAEKSIRNKRTAETSNDGADSPKSDCWRLRLTSFGSHRSAHGQNISKRAAELPGVVVLDDNFASGSNF